MASTTVILSTTALTDISGGLANGLVTNESKYTQMVQQAGALPDAADVSGHTNRSGKFYNWASITENIYARSLPNQSDRPGTNCEVTAQA